jgi:hypothetical protein
MSNYSDNAAVPTIAGIAGQQLIESAGQRDSIHDCSRSRRHRLTSRAARTSPTKCSFVFAGVPCLG